jgi:hypothetical protein
MSSIYIAYSLLFVKNMYLYLLAFKSASQPIVGGE